MLFQSVSLFNHLSEFVEGRSTSVNDTFAVFKKLIQSDFQTNVDILIIFVLKIVIIIIIIIKIIIIIIIAIVIVMIMIIIKNY